MADEPTDAPDDKDAPKDSDKPDDTGDLGEPGKKALEAERRARKAAEKAAKDFEARIKELEDKDKSETEKLRDAAAKAEKDKAEAHAAYLRLKVGTAKGLDPEVAELLRGETEEELEAHADRLAEKFKPGKPGGDADQGNRGKAPDGKGEDMNALLRAAATGSN